MLKLVSLILSLLPVTVLAADGLPSPSVPKQLTITATEEEAKALVQMLDIAVKSCGLNCAQTGVAWVLKLQGAINAVEPPKKE